MNSRILKNSIAILLGCASTGTLAAIAPAFAADATTGIETVMVTAERRVENQQDVPISIATLSGDNLDSIFESGEDIKAIANHVPGLYAESSNGRVAPRFYIRGLGNSDFDLAASQPVSILMDDVVQENVVLKSAPIFDIDNVEVDRGPQGTLFGRNTTAGVIKFDTRKPTQDQNGYLTASYGELDTANVEGAITEPLTDTLSMRVSGLWQNRSNYINNTFTGEDGALGGYQDRAARVQFLWTPDDNFSALLNIHGRSLDGTAAIFRANIIGPGNNHLNSNYSWDNVQFDGGANNPQKYDGVGSSLVLNYNLPWGMKLTSISGYEETHGYSRGDIDGGNLNGPGIIFFPSESQDGLDYLNQFSQEIHLASDNPDSPLFWQVGGYYFNNQFQDTTTIAFNPNVATSVRQSDTSYAAFGQASYKITPDFTVTAGVRWTSDVKGLTASGGILSTPILKPVKLTGDNVSWDVSADYALEEGVNVYARVSSGFRAPSIQGRNLAFDEGFSTARSETVQSYEGGVKTDLLGNTLRLNADGFFYYVHNMQLSAIGGAAVGNSIILLNAHGGLAYGMESDAQWAPTNDLLFTLGASWTHTEIRSPGLETGVCAQCTVTNPIDPLTGGAYINGNPFPQAPDFLLSASAKYTYPLKGGDSFFAYTNWWLQGYTNFFLYKSKEFHTLNNYEGDVRVGYTFPSGLYDLFVYAQNVTDQQNIQGGIDFDDNTGFTSDPRVVGVGFMAHF